MEISHFRHIHEADITLISHNGHIHGEGDGGAVWRIPAHVPSVQHLQGPVPLRLADPVVWLQVLGHVTREVPLQRHVGGSNCSTQLNRLLEIRFSRSASIKSRDMVSRGTEKDFGVLLRGSVEMMVHLVLLVPLLVL